MKPLEGKKALVTGGSRGIGRAIALRLAHQGADVVIGYKQNKDKALEVVAEMNNVGCKGYAIRADLSNPEAIVRHCDEAEKSIGQLDIVVANAADIIVKPLADCTEEDYNRIFNTNVKGVFFTLKEAAKRLKENGRIIVSSTGGTKLFFPDNHFIWEVKEQLSNLYGL